MEKEISVVVDELGMKLMYKGRCILNVAGLDRVADPDSVIHRLQVDFRWQSRLLLKFFCGLLEAL